MAPIVGQFSIMLASYGGGRPPSSESEADGALESDSLDVAASPESSDDDWPLRPGTAGTTGTAGSGRRPLSKAAAAVVGSFVLVGEKRAPKRSRDRG